MLWQLPWISPLCAPPPSAPYSLRQPSHYCSCPRIMSISSLATPFPLLYFTSPWLFCNYLLLVFNPLTSSCFLPLPYSIWQPSGNFFSLAAFKSLPFPGLCGLVDGELACKLKGCWFNSQTGHNPGLQVRSPAGGIWEATNWYISHTLMFLSLSFSLSSLSKSK